MSVPVQRTPVVAVVPVKPLRDGKSRLSLPSHQRRALAEAFALDVVAALRSCPLVAEVRVVTADRRLELLLPGDVRVVPDPGGGLHSALQSGCAGVGPQHAVLVVPADLPFLTSAAVSRLLLRHAEGFVPDRDGTGTTLLLRPPGSRVEPRYGEGSAGAHAGLGLPRLEQVPSGLRHDVDRVEDLRPDPGERLAPATRAVLRRLPVLDRLAS